MWENFANSQILFSRSTDGGASFSSPVNLTREQQGDEPEIAVSGSNNVYIICNNRNFTLGFFRGTNGGASFSYQKTFGDENSSEIDDARLVAFGKNVYVVLFNTSTKQFPIYFIRDTHGGTSFSSPILLSKNETGEVETSEGYPWLAISRNGTIYVVWYDGDNSNLLFSRGT